MKTVTLNHQFRTLLFHQQFVDRLISVNWNWFLIQPGKKIFQTWIERTERENTNVKTKVFARSLWTTMHSSTSNVERGTASKLIHIHLKRANREVLLKAFSLHKHNVGRCSAFLLPLNLLRSFNCSLVFVCGMMAMNNVIALLLVFCCVVPHSFN